MKVGLLLQQLFIQVVEKPCLLLLLERFFLVLRVGSDEDLVLAVPLSEFLLDSEKLVEFVLLGGWLNFLLLAWLLKWESRTLRLTRFGTHPLLALLQLEKIVELLFFELEFTSDHPVR